MQKTLKVSDFGLESKTIDCRMHTRRSVFTGRHLSFHSRDGRRPSTPALMHSFAIFVLQKKETDEKKNDKKTKTKKQKQKKTKHHKSFS